MRLSTARSGRVAHIDEYGVQRSQTHVHSSELQVDGQSQQEEEGDGVE